MVILTPKELLKTNVLVRYEPCVMCGARPGDGRLTAGSLRRDGSQAYACTIHLLRERRQWIIFWALFDASQHASHGDAQ